MHAQYILIWYYMISFIGFYQNSDQLTANIAKGRRTQGLSAFVSKVILQVQQIQLQKLDQT